VKVDTDTLDRKEARVRRRLGTTWRGTEEDDEVVGPDISKMTEADRSKLERQQKEMVELVDGLRRKYDPARFFETPKAGELQALGEK